MVLAPHPDDESLGTGILLQRAVANGAAIRIVYVTDGDDNAWPQRALDRKWRLNSVDRRRWGKRRRRESLAALKELGVDATSARFLGFPDQKLTRLLLCAGDQTSARIAQFIKAWAPTDVVLPSCADTHPDHSALAILARYAIAKFVPADQAPLQWSYIVHGNQAASGRSGDQLIQTTREKIIKAQAIACHRTQMLFSRRRFMEFAQRNEHYVLGEKRLPSLGKSLKFVLRRENELHLRLALPPEIICGGGDLLYISARDFFGVPVGVALRISTLARSAALIHCASGLPTAQIDYRHDCLTGEFVLPTDSFAQNHPLYIKLRRRMGFFDQMGWVEISPERRDLSQPGNLEKSLTNR